MGRIFREDGGVTVEVGLEDILGLIYKMKRVRLDMRGSWWDVRKEEDVLEIPMEDVISASVWQSLISKKPKPRWLQGMTKRARRRTSIEIDGDKIKVRFR